MLSPVNSAGDGQSAVENARVHKPQKVVLDLSLPDMDGYEVISRMKALCGIDKATFIALTVFGEDQEERAIQAGFNYFLTKPIDMEQLIKLLEMD
jgi:CheY-like chemotaxis protein